MASCINQQALFAASAHKCGRCDVIETLWIGDTI